MVLRFSTILRTLALLYACIYSVLSTAQPCITEQPNDTIICIGGTASFSVEAPDSSDFRWQVLNSVWLNVGSQDFPIGFIYSDSSLSILDISNTAIVGSYQYRCIVSNVQTECSDTTETAILTVVSDPSEPTATKSPNVTDVCAGQLITLLTPNSNGGAGNCTYQYALNEGGFSSTLPNVPAQIADNSIFIQIMCDGSGCDPSPIATFSWSGHPDPLMPTATPSPNATAVCAGQSLTFIDVIDNGGGTGSCLLKYSTNGIDYSTTLPLITPTVGQHTIYVRKECSGNVDCINSTPYSFTWTVVPDPGIPSAVKLPNTNDVCEGDTLSLTNVNVGANGTGDCDVEYAYLTNGGLNYTNWTETMPVVVAEQGQNIIKIRTACAGFGCSPSNEILFTWNAQPSPQLIVSPDQNVCLGNNVQIFAAGGDSYTWLPQESLNFHLISDPIATPEVSTQYIVRTVGPNGCDAYGFITISVLTGPPVNAGADRIVCASSDTVLEATGADAYQWNPTLGLSNPFVANPVFTLDETITYAVMGSDDSECTSVDYVTITVSDPPIANAGNDVEVCAGSSLSIIANGGTGYSWSPATYLDNAAIQSPLVTPLESMNYTVTVTDENNCTAQDEIMITVSSPPMPEISGDEEVCQNEFWASYETSYNYSSYNWQIEGGTITTDNGAQQILVHWDMSPTGQLVVFETSYLTGCIASDTLNVSKYDLAAPDTTLVYNLGNNVLVCSDSISSIYQWGLEEIETGAEYMTCGDYQYCQFDALNTSNFYYWVLHGTDSGCLTKSYYNGPNEIVRIETDDILNDVLIYPNPTCGNIYVAWSGHLLDNATYFITSIDGSIAKVEIEYDSPVVLDLNELPVGFYVLHILGDYGYTNYKIVKL